MGDNNCDFRHIGIMYAIFSSFMYSGNILFAKMMTIPALQISFSRGIIQYLLIIPMVLYKNRVEKIIGPKEARIHLWARGFFGTASGLLQYLAVKNLTPGNVASLQFLDIVFVPIFGRIFYKATLTLFDGFFAILAFSGVVLIAQPPFLFPNHVYTEENPIGVLYAVLSAVSASFSYHEIKIAGESASFLVVTLYYSVVCGVSTGTLMFATGSYEMPCMAEILKILAGLGICGFTGMCALTLACKYERPGTITILMTLQIIIVYAFQILVLHDIPTTLSLVGSGLIFSTTICIGMRKLVNEKKRRRSVAKGMMR